jgi:hypothetical protein
VGRQPPLRSVDSEIISRGTATPAADKSRKASREAAFSLKLFAVVTSNNLFWQRCIPGPDYYGPTSLWAQGLIRVIIRFLWLTILAWHIVPVLNSMCPSGVDH